MPDYRPEVLEELIVHGVRPRASTPPRLVRAYLNEMYRYEIRVLKSRLLRGDFPQSEYIPRVLELRARYPLLGIPIDLWQH